MEKMIEKAVGVFFEFLNNYDLTHSDECIISSIIISASEGSKQEI